MLRAARRSMFVWLEGASRCEDHYTNKLCPCKNRQPSPGAHALPIIIHLTNFLAIFIKLQKSLAPSGYSRKAQRKKGLSGRQSSHFESPECFYVADLFGKTRDIRKMARNCSGSNSISARKRKRGRRVLSVCRHIRRPLSPARIFELPFPTAGRLRTCSVPRRRE
jgi:hypothetical protein